MQNFIFIYIFISTTFTIFKLPKKKLFNSHSYILESIFELNFTLSMIGIRITLKIEKIEMKLSPTDNDKIHTLLISNEYLHIFNLLYIFDSS